LKTNAQADSQEDEESLDAESGNNNEETHSQNSNDMNNYSMERLIQLGSLFATSLSQ
jgi:hypothetical protein